MLQCMGVGGLIRVAGGRHRGPQDVVEVEVEHLVVDLELAHWC